MEHPLRSDENRELRRGIASLFRDGYAIQRQSNIIFVCGGNDSNSMRRRFQLEFSKLLPEFEFFEPEFAMKNYFTLDDSSPFDVSEFEELVGELSHSIVLFPEAAGSLAETGYFSARPMLARKILLAIDAKRQKSDSFISLGPAKKIHDASRFQPNIQFDYDNPDFSIISERILERSPLNKNKKALKIADFSDTSTFELFAIINELVSLIGMAHIEDIEFFLRSIYSGHISSSKSKKIVSILVGSNRLAEIGEYGHFKANDQKTAFLHLKDGAKTTHDALAIKISSTFLDADQEFATLVGAKLDVG